MLRSRIGVVLFAVWMASAGGAQQHTHTPAAAGAGTAQAAHHAFLEQERAAIERGEGFGMALPADRSGYPGPKHILELKDELKLTAGQQAAVEKLFAHMKEKAIARGKEVLSAEARLEKMFADRRPEAELREESFRVASLRAELRWVHLEAHLAARKLLTPEQLSTYHHLRWGNTDHTHSGE